MPVGELFYFTLPSPNLEKSKKFYSSIFDWSIGGGSQGGNVDSANTTLGLGGSDHQVYFYTPDITASVKLVQQEGGNVLKEEVYPNVGKAAYCQDNQGTNFVLQEPSENLLPFIPQKGSKHGDLFFFSIPVMDDIKAQKFFSAVLELEFGEKGPEGGMGIQNFKGPDGGLGCGRPGHNPSFWFRVEKKVEDTIKRVQEAGGTCGDVFDAPEGRMSECVDDQGIKFGIVEPAPGY